MSRRNLKQVDLLNALVAAVQRLDLEGVRRALDAGADPYGLTNNPLAPPLTVQWMLNLGVSASLVINHHSWLMMVQSPADSFGASTDLLIKAGANIDFQNDGGFTALHRTVELGSKEGFMRLLRAGARVDLPGNGGQTLRQHLAQRADRREMNDLLIAWEASQSAHQAIVQATKQTHLRPLEEA